MRLPTDLEVQTSQKILTAVWEASPDAWVLSDASGIVLDANPAYLTFYGLAREQTIGAPFVIIFPEDFRAKAMAQYQEAFAKAPPQSTFETVFSQDDTPRVVETTISFLVENGRRLAMLSCIRDVTKYKAQQEKLARQSRYERALAECSKTLLQQDPTEDDQQQLLNAALEHLRLAAQADRAYLFENFEDAEDGFCSGIRAEARAPEVRSNLLNPDSQKIPWSVVPEQNRIMLANGRSVGGPIARTFAGKPDMIAWLLDLGIQSVLFLPIQIGGYWWGYVGFDDCQAPREWLAEDITLLQTAAEILSSTSQRWHTHEALRNQYRYQEALARCSQILLNNPHDGLQEELLLTEALAHLRQAVRASRAYILHNINLPDIGPGMCLLAESCASGVWPHIQNPANKQMPWASLPDIWRQHLARRQSFGGPIKQAFATTPEWIEIFEKQRNPLLSFQTFPIFIDEDWWGFVGFDDVDNPRQWSDEEITLLRTASEIIASTLQRWEASKVLEERVQQRTADLRETNEQLQAQIRQREQAEADLARRLEVEQVLTNLSSHLLQPEETSDLLVDTLRGLGQLVHARRMLLVHLDEARNPLDRAFFQWHQPGLLPLPPELPTQLIKAFPWMWQQMQRGETVLWRGDADLPEAAAFDQLSLVEQEVEALALFPMLSEGELTAVLIYNNFAPQDENQADNLRILQLGANLIENLLRRATSMAFLEQRVAERTQDLTALFDFTMQTSQAETVADMLEPAIQHIADTTHCQAICVHLFSPEDQNLTLAAQLGLPVSTAATLRKITSSPAVNNLLKYTEKQALLATQPTLPAVLPPEFHLPEYQIYLGSQLRVRGRPIGFLSAYRAEKRPFTLNEISLLVVLAEQLGVLVENHHLLQRAAEMAIVGERQRLARELHDSITQSLYSQTLFARAARYALEDDAGEKLQDSLHQLELGALAALKEMRLLLFQMKPLALEKLSLQEAIEQRFDDVERRLGIEALCQLPDPPHFSEEVILELYRVIMEALNNSLKHAEAEAVQVRLQAAEDTAVLTITDDGCGFDINQINPGMGLGYMAERVATIQGHITMESVPGIGTTITIQLPIAVT